MAFIFRIPGPTYIYVRYFDAPRISNYLRITVGTDEEMNELLRFLKAYLKS